MHIQFMVRCLYSEGKLFPLTEFGAMRQASGGRGDGRGLDGRPEMLNRETVSGRDNHLMSCKVQTNFIKRLFAHTLAPAHSFIPGLYGTHISQEYTRQGMAGDVPR